MFTLPGGQTLPGGRLQALSSASSCADPMCLMCRDLRREECTICTAVAPDRVVVGDGEASLGQAAAVGEQLDGCIGHR